MSISPDRFQLYLEFDMLTIYFIIIQFTSQDTDQKLF